MIRVLIIDDLPGELFISEMREAISSSFPEFKVETVHLNPVDAFKSGNPQEDLAQFLDVVSKRAEEFWDAVVIDVNLAELRQLPENERLHLSLSIAGAFRDTNHSATTILYSGTLADHVKKLLQGAVTPEAALKRIFRAGIANFVPRNRITDEVLVAIDNPSWMLRIDRLLMRHASLRVIAEEAEFSGKSLGELAMFVRRQNHEGQKVAQIVAEYGISSFVDLNS